MALSSAAFASVLVVLQELATPGAGLVALPHGRVAEMLERLGEAAPEKDPHLGPPWPAWDDRSPAGWGGEVAWRRWVELLRAEAAARPSTPSRRAELACLARLQGRDGDAWGHLLACEAEPGLVAALLPHFSPGVPRELLDEKTLPDGVVLTPALPPVDEARAGLRWLAGTKIERREFTVGEARCALTVSVDRDGLEVSVRHLSGGPARVRVSAPLPGGVEPGLLFADWEKLPGHVGPVEFRLDAESNEHSLWLTFQPPRVRWPSPPLAMLRAPLPGQELWLVSPRGDEPHLQRFAEALSELFGLVARGCDAGKRPPPGLEPIVLRFDPGPASERMLVDLIGLAEALALSAPDR